MVIFSVYVNLPEGNWYFKGTFTKQNEEIVGIEYDNYVYIYIYICICVYVYLVGLEYVSFLIQLVISSSKPAHIFKSGSKHQPEYDGDVL